MKKNKTKSILACAVLAGVLAGGNVQAAANHNAVISPASMERGQSVVFGNITSGVVTGPVVWDVVLNDGKTVTVFSQKGLQSFQIQMQHDEEYCPDFRPKYNGGGNERVLSEFQGYFKYDSSQWVMDNFSLQEAMVFGKDLGVPTFEQIKNGGTFGLTPEQRKADNGKYGINEYSMKEVINNNLWDEYYVLQQIDEEGNVYTNFALTQTTMARPYINLNSDYVLFASVKDGGKGTVGVGGLAVLPKVTNTSALELTMDDAFLAGKTSTARQTGDVQITGLKLAGDALSVDYKNGLYIDNTSYLSYFVGEGDAAADYFAYGKASVMGNVGSGNSGNIALASVKGKVLNGKGMALTFFNEYGNGTSWAGNLAKLPGSLTFGTDGNLIYTTSIADIAGLEAVDIGEKNILKLTDSGYAGTVSAPAITGKGTVQVAGDFTFSGDNHVFQGVLEVLDGHTLTLTGNDLYYSIIGNIKLQQDTTYRGTKLAGTVSSATGTETLKLSNDLQIGADLSIENLDAQGKTLDMRQGEGTPTYNTLTIGKLWGNANLAIDVGKKNDAFTSDKIILNGVEGSAKITLNAINLIDDPQLAKIGKTKTINGVVGGTEKGNVEVASGLVAYGATYKYAVSLDNVGNLTLDYAGVKSDGFKEFVESTNNASYSFVGDTILNEAVTTGSAGSETDITKTVFLNGYTLRSPLAGLTPNGITVANTHTLTMKGGDVCSFATALKVLSGGTLNLQNMHIYGNMYGRWGAGVANAGTMNIGGDVRIDTLTGNGTTNIGMGAKLILMSSYGDEENSGRQTFTGDGILYFNSMDGYFADVTQIQVATTTVAKPSTLYFDSGTLGKVVSGEGKILVRQGKSITTDAGNLQVSEVVNAGTLKIQPATGNENKINSLKTNITGGGSLELYGFNEAHGAITQDTVTIAKNSILDAYKPVTANITNNGAAFFFVGDLLVDVTNVLPPAGSETFTAPGGSTLLNGLTALYTDTNNRILQKKITGGHIGIMGEVISNLNNLAGEVYIAGGHTLTLQGGASGSAANITQPIQGAESKMTGYGNGSLVTDGYFTADLDKILMPFENKGTMNLSVGTNHTNMDKITSIINSGTMNINAGVILNGARIEGGKVSLADGVNFKTANLVNIAELAVNNAIYNFNANLAGTPSMDIIDAEKVTGTLKLGTVILFGIVSEEEWGLDEAKEVRFLKDTTGHTVVVDNTTAAFDSDCKYTFRQAKNDDSSNKIGFLSILKTKGGELWKIIRGKTIDGYDTSEVCSYSLTSDYHEQLEDVGTEAPTTALGILQKSDTTTNREFTINGNGFVFDGNSNKGITVGTGGVLNFLNMGDITGWDGFVVTNSGTVNFNGTNVLNSKVTGGGTFNNNGELTVADVEENLGINELNNNGMVKIGYDTEKTLNTKITGGILEITGKIMANIVNLAPTMLVIAADNDGNDATFNKLEIYYQTTSSTLQNMAVQNYGILDISVPIGNIIIQNAETLNLKVGVGTSEATIYGGKVNIETDMTTKAPILANEINIDAHTLTVEGAEDTSEFLFGKITATGDANLNITKGTVYALDEVNSKIILGTNVNLDIAADNIKKSVEIGTNANLNLGDGTLKTTTITGTNSGTVNFLGKVAVETGTSIPKATFKNGSTLVLDAKTDTAPLTITTEINIDSGAKLYVNGAEKNGTYKIVSGTPIDSAFAGWTLRNIRGEDANGHKVKGKEYTVEGNVYSVFFKTAVPENTDLGKLLENADGTPLADWAEKVCDAFDTAYGDAGEAYTANAINSMASASVLAGAQKGAATMVTQVAGNISANVGVGARPTLSGVRGQVSGVRNVSADVKLASPLEGKRADKGAWSGEGVDETAINTVEVGKASEVMPTEYKDKVYDKQVWASYIHSKQKIDGLKTGSLTQNSTIQLNGVTVGADLWSGKKSFGGLAITYADGNANSSQMSNSTKNEAKYYGISMYHRQDMGKYALTTDIGYTYNKNDITQHTTGITDEVTSKPKTHAYTVGMKLEREIYLSKACKIVPFAGARYTRLQNRDFSNSLGANTKVDNQNLVTVPVGLSFHSHLITTEGWKLGSILEGGYEWNFGNRHSTQEFGYGGAYNSIGFDVVDRGQYFVKAALTADYENMFFELGYRYSKGKSVRDNKWNFNANFIF